MSLPDNDLMACVGATIKIVDPTSTVSGSLTISPVGPGAAPSSTSSKVKCSGNEAYTGIGFTVTGATNGTIEQGTGSGVIQGTAVKTKLNGTAPVRKQDTYTAIISGVISPSTPGTFDMVVGIDNPGQKKARCQ